MEALAKVILFVLCFVQSSYSLCTYVNGSTRPQVCSLYSAVSKRELKDNKFISVNYEVNLETKDCSLPPDVKAKATINKGSAALSVTATNSKAKINIPSDLGKGDHEIDFELIMTDKCEQTDMVSLTLNQTLWLSVVDDPVLQHVNDLPHKMKCHSTSDISTEWFRYERDGEPLGYCGPDESALNYLGGFRLHHQFSNESVCELTMTETHYGSYTCSIKYNYIDEPFTSDPVQITKKDQSQFNTLAKGLVGGLVVLSVVLILLLIIMIVAYIVFRVRRNQDNVRREEQDERRQIIERPMEQYNDGNRQN